MALMPEILGFLGNGMDAVGADIEGKIITHHFHALKRDAFF